MVFKGKGRHRLKQHTVHHGYLSLSKSSQRRTKRRRRRSRPGIPAKLFNKNIDVIFINNNPLISDFFEFGVNQ